MLPLLNELRSASLVEMNVFVDRRYSTVNVPVEALP